MTASFGGKQGYPPVSVSSPMPSAHRSKAEHKKIKNKMAKQSRKKKRR